MYSGTPFNNHFFRKNLVLTMILIGTSYIHPYELYFKKAITYQLEYNNYKESKSC